MFGKSSISFLKPVLFFSAVILLFVFFCSGTAQALMPRIAEEELIKDADLIVTGEVSNIQSYWNDRQDYIYSNITVIVEKVLSEGHLQYKEITVVVPGGVVGDIGQVDSLSPVFSVGQEVFLYLQPLAEGPSSAMMLPNQEETPLFSVLGRFQGKKDIVAGKINNIPLESYIAQIKSIQLGEIDTFITGKDEEEQPLVVNEEGLNYVLNNRQWPSSSIPVQYRVNASGGPSGSLNAIRNAANAWSNAGSRFSFNYAGTHSRTGGHSSNGINEVSFYNSGGSELGEAIWWFTPSTGNIVEADFYFNTRESWSTTGSNYDVQTVGIHEFGHWLSLGHSANSNACMYAYYQGIRRNLHSDDIAGIRAIYGTTSVTVPPRVTLKSPANNANVAGTRVVFNWNAAARAEKYQLQVRRASNNTIFKNQTLGNITRRAILDFPADGAQYKWLVRAGNAAGWGPWSAYRQLRNPFGAFNHNFNTTNGYRGWIRRPATDWNLNNTAMLTAGQVNRWVTARRGNVYYRNLDYSVRMRRTNTPGPNYPSSGIVIRAGGKYETNGDWYPSYRFHYTNSGYYSIFRKNPNGSLVAIQGWTASNHINKNGWNTLRVRAVNNNLRFFINGNLVRSINDSSLARGFVGVMAYSGSDTPANSRLLVAWARLTNPVTSSASVMETMEAIDPVQQAFNEEAQEEMAAGRVDLMEGQSIVKLD